MCTDFDRFGRKVCSKNEQMRVSNNCQTRVK